MGVRVGPRPRGSLARSLMRALVVALVVCVAVFAVSVVVREPGSSPAWADVWLYNSVMVIAAVIAAIRSGTAGQLTRPWLLIAAALVTDALGGILYAEEADGVVPTMSPVPLSDIVWLSYYPLAFIGLLLLTRRRLSLRQGYAWLDALVVGTGAFAVGLAVMSTVAEPGSTTTADLVNSLYLIGDLILVVLVLTVIQSFNGHPPVAWWLLMAGFLCVVAADTGYLIEVSSGSYTEGGLLDVLWPLSAMLTGLAAWQDRQGAAPPIQRRRLSYVGPSIAILAAAVVLGVYDADFLRTMTLLAAFGTIVLAVVRLNLDVQQSLRLTDQLRRSQVDSLTGLMNRRGLLATDTRAARSCALILMDLDAFKDVNDTLGHASGDRLLIAVAARLRERVREDDVLARLGGDEFAVLLWNTAADGACSAAEDLVRHLEQPMSLEGIPILVTACAGVADDAYGAADLSTMLKQADTALYAAKSEGPGLVRAFAGATGDQSQERLRIRAEARAALDAGGGEFVVHYQPMVGITRDHLLCVESLVRWQHAGRLLPPGDFLPEIIRGGEMPQLTRHMLRTSLRELSEQGLAVPVTVNVPPELITDWLVAESTRALEELGLPPERLIIEITEEAIMKDPEGVAGVLHALRDRGIRVLLDDFGTGWSGLSSLRDLIVDGIKVDHSFVSRLTTDPTAASIIRGISQVAADLDLVVIYEGAESADVLDALAEYPTGYVQGFSRARPMPVADLRRWLALNGHAVGARA